MELGTNGQSCEAIKRKIFFFIHLMFFYVNQNLNSFQTDGIDTLCSILLFGRMKLGKSFDHLL